MERKRRIDRQGNECLSKRGVEYYQALHPRLMRLPPSKARRLQVIALYENIRRGEARQLVRINGNPEFLPPGKTYSRHDL